MRRLISIVLLCCFVSFLDAADLQGITSTQLGHKTSLFFSINGAFTHRLFFLKAPDRVVLDLSGTRLHTNPSQLRLTNTLIKQIRTGRTDALTLRLVFDVRQKVQLSSSPWRAGHSSNGLRVDITPIGPALQAKYVKKTAQIPKETRASTPLKPLAVPTLHSPALSSRDVIVVLDAGHGGKDPGARGPHHSREKDVVLAITMKLKQLIDRQVGMRAVLTRSGDYYVGLRRRLDIARKYNGDVFVSIHADAFNNPHSNGASVFALSQRGATSEAARWLAEKENYSELGGINLGDLDDQNGIVRSVLIDLSQTATINSGLHMGGRVLHQLGGFTSLHNNKVEQARFMVLKSPDIPSILVETGFISNPREERNLTSSAYQTRLSQAIFQGVKAYFWENPPHGSRIEAMLLKKQVHIARSG